MAKQSSSRKARRRAKRMCPRDLAYEELAAGTITATEVERRREKLESKQCSSTWSEDIWYGRDRDYASERKIGFGARVFTGSGIGKVRCRCCRRDVPPQNCPGAICDECRFDRASPFMHENVVGSNQRALLGG